MYTNNNHYIKIPDYLALPDKNRTFITIVKKKKLLWIQIK